MFERPSSLRWMRADEAALIGRIAELERVKSAAAAGQARAAARLDELRRADEAATGVPLGSVAAGWPSEGGVGATGFPGARWSAPRVRQGAAV